MGNAALLNIICCNSYKAKPIEDIDINKNIIENNNILNNKDDDSLEDKDINNNELNVINQKSDYKKIKTHSKISSSPRNVKKKNETKSHRDPNIALYNNTFEILNNTQQFISISNKINYFKNNLVNNNSKAYRSFNNSLIDLKNSIINNSRIINIEDLFQLDIKTKLILSGELFLNKDIEIDKFGMKNGLRQKHDGVSIFGIKNNKIPILIMQISNSINIKGPELPKPQIIEVQKNWNNLLRGQRSGKFCLTGKPKLIKKTKLLVANGDKFFIQKEIDDENKDVYEIYQRNIALEKEIAQRTEELRLANQTLLTLEQVWDMMNSSRPLSNVLETIVSSLYGEFGYIYSFIAQRQFDDNGGICYALRTYLENEFSSKMVAMTTGSIYDFKLHPPKDGVIENAIDKKEVAYYVSLEDFIEENIPDCDTEKAGELLAKNEAKTIIIFPISVQNQFFGFLSVFSPRKELKDDELSFLNLFSRQIELAITIANLFETEYPDESYGSRQSKRKNPRYC